MNNKKAKLQSLLSRLEQLKGSLPLTRTKDILDSVLEEGASNFKDHFKNDPTVKYLGKINERLEKFKKENNLNPIITSIEKLQGELKTLSENSTKELEASKVKEEGTKKELLGLLDKNRGDLEKLTTREIDKITKSVDVLFDSLNAQTISSSQRETTNASLFKTFESKIQGIEDGIKSSQTNHSVFIDSVEQRFGKSDTSHASAVKAVDDLRKEIMSKMSSGESRRGGSPNQQINVNSSVMSQKYADINFVSDTAIRWSAVDNDTKKWVDLRASLISGGSGGPGGTPGGSDTQVQFNDAGAFGGAEGITWNKDSSVLAVNSIQFAPTQAISSVFTVNGYRPAYSGADVTVGHRDANFSSVANALPIASASGGTYYVSDGTYSEASIVAVRSATRLNLSQGATLQTDGATNPIFIQTSTAGLSRVVMDGGKLLQTNATAQGVAISLDNTPNAWVSRMRIEEFGTGIQANDTGNTTFYNSARDIQMFNVNNGIALGGTQPNMNIWDNIRIRPKAGGAGTGVNLAGSVRGNTFLNVDVEPATGTGITGIHLQGDSRDNLFLGNWIENNENGVVIDSGADNNIFIGGTITDNITADIVDNGTGTAFWGVNRTGRKLFKVPKITDTTGKAQLTFTENSGTVRFGQPSSLVGGIEIAGSIVGVVKVQAASTAGNWTLTLPPNDGSANQVLTTDGNGISTWASVAAVGGSGITRNISTVTTDTTAADSASTDYVYFVGAGIRFTLPAAPSNTNLYTVKNFSSSSVLVLSGEGIDDSPSALMPSNYESLSFISNSSIWGVV